MADLPGLADLDARWLGKVRAWEGASARGVLAPKLVALIRLLLDITLTHMDARGAQRHMKTAAAHGASRAEILAVMKLACVIGVHSYATAAPEIRAALEAAGHEAAAAPAVPTPFTDAVRDAGSFNPGWEDIARWDAPWLERFLDVGFAVWTDRVLDPRTVELLCVAGDACVTHLWSSGVRRHAEAALRHGATHEELLEVLRIVSAQGVESLEFALPILDALGPDAAAWGG